MKKLNYFLLGAAGLLLASCSQEDIAVPGGDGSVQVTISLPDGVGTRAAIGSGEAAVNLQYAVYETNVVNGNTTYSLVYNNTINGFFSAGMSNTLSLDLIKGKEYTVAFFAESANAADIYSFSPENQTLSVEYSKMTSTENNADDYDCFINTWETGVIDASISGKVLLYRPVAQVNWGSSDLGSPIVQKAYGTNGANIWTTLKIENAPQTLNFLTGALSNEGNEGNVEIGPFAIPTGAGNVQPGFPYVGMQYVLTSKTSSNYDLSLTIANDQTSPTESVEIPVTNVPLQANYQTNIYGSLLTNSANLTIELNSSWGIPSNDIVEGAIVKFENGTVICETPVLPAGVTEADMAKADVGAVAISADGTPVYFGTTGADIKDAMANYSEIYLAPNSTITISGHTMLVPQRGVTIHGNGATLTGAEQDFVLPTPGTYNEEYETGSTVNLTISNLNGVKVWGGPTGAYTINVNLTNCTLTGKGLANGSLSLVMASGADSAETTINFNLQNCRAQNTQVGFFSKYPGTTVINNCVFDNVGIPINIAKKLKDAKADITVSNCIFNDCGIKYTDTGNDAYNYAAPVRVVDNGGPANYTTLLVDNCTFENTQSEWDILLWDYRPDKTSFPVKYSIQNCTPANPTVNTNSKPSNP